MRAKYSVGTYDYERTAYTPQRGAGRSINISLRQLRRVLKRLRRMGYGAWRVGNTRDESTRDSDPDVLVERTDGMTKDEILKRWDRNPFEPQPQEPQGEE